jgi:hypothetical protein
LDLPSLPDDLVKIYSCHFNQPLHCPASSLPPLGLRAVDTAVPARVISVMFAKSLRIIREEQFRIGSRLIAGYTGNR